MVSNVHIPKDIEGFLEKNLTKEGDILRKNASINWDGKNFLIRIPKDIAGRFDLNQKNALKKKMLFIVETKNSGRVSKTFDIIKREEPKRITKNENKKKITKKR